MEVSPPAFLVLFLVVVGCLVLVFLLQLRKETGRIELTNGSGAKIPMNVELADNDAKRARGLMFRDKLGADEGMLFIFDAEHYLKFWMMNTTIPLDAAFFSSDGRVIDVIQMEPCKSLFNCPTYGPAGKAKYVLEVNKGFCQRNGITNGTTMRIIGGG